MSTHVAANSAVERVRVAHVFQRGLDPGSEDTTVICAAADTEQAWLDLLAEPDTVSARFERAPPARVEALTGEYRAAAVGRDLASAASALAERLGRRPPVRSVNTRPVFLFSGQGSQYPNMGRELYRLHAGFRSIVDRCAALFDRQLPKPLRDVMFAGDEREEDLNSTLFTQPALFTLELALASMWRESGVVPSAVIGHSIGELAAACFASVVDLETAVRLVSRRASLMASLPPGGSMLSVLSGAQEVSEQISRLGCRLDIAAINGANSTVVSGSSVDVGRLSTALQERTVTHEPLSVSHAFHSYLMEPILDEFERQIASIAPSSPRYPLVSNLTGITLEATQPMDAQYFRKQLRSTVRFATCLSHADGRYSDTYLEIGPRPVLSSIARRHLGRGARVFLPSLTQRAGDMRAVLSAAAEMFQRGVDISFETLVSLR